MTSTSASLEPRPVGRGKVRDLYDVGDGLILMVTSDRISAFDVVFDELIPEKGRVLTATTAFWSENVADLVPGSIVTADPEVYAERVARLFKPGDVAGRAMLVRRAEMIPLECIVRGYLAGQAYSEYERNGTIHGAAMPARLRLADPLPEPIFTPSTKAESGHDENVDFETAARIVGRDVADTLRDRCLSLYERASHRLGEVGLILADTKFEFGYVDGEIVLCDEILTPDSSRIWPSEAVVAGTTPPSFDKQPLRDWADAQPWDKTPPPPRLPDEVVEATSARYVAAYERVTGLSIAQWYGSAR